MKTPKNMTTQEIRDEIYDIMAYDSRDEHSESHWDALYHRWLALANEKAYRKYRVASTQVAQPVIGTLWAERSSGQRRRLKEWDEGQAILSSEDGFRDLSVSPYTLHREWVKLDEAAYEHADPIDAEDGLLSPDQRADVVQACNAEPRPLRVSGTLPEGFAPTKDLHRKQREQELEKIIDSYKYQ